MNVLENNTLTGGRRGILLSAPANWTLIRNNKLEVLDPEESKIEYYGRQHVVAPLILHEEPSEP